jgi:hypothetical protein
VDVELKSLADADAPHLVVAGESGWSVMSIAFPSRSIVKTVLRLPSRSRPEPITRVSLSSAQSAIGRPSIALTTSPCAEAASIAGLGTLVWSGRSIVRET